MRRILAAVCILVVSIILLLPKPSSCQCSPSYIFERPPGSTLHGLSVDFVLDIDGDGHDEFIIGSPGTSGQVEVFSGRDTSVIWSYESPSAGTLWGYSVSGAGDVDNDGTPDFIIGQPGYDNEDTDVGRVRVYSGDGSPSQILWTFTGNDPFDQFGFSVDGIGDINNDGHADIIVGVPGITGIGAGKAYIYSGQTGSILDSVYETQGGANLGFSVANLGDINSDGRSDVAIGSPGFDDGPNVDEGKVVVRSPSAQSDLFTVNGSFAGERFGFSVDGAGDWNNNGQRDIVIGAPLYAVPGANAGRFSVHSGATGAEITNITSGIAGIQLGNAVAGLEDTDADGFSEVAVCANLDDKAGADAGVVIVYSGATEDTVGVYYGSAIAGANCGIGLAGGGDFNNDGSPDLLIGAPLDATVVAAGGRAFAYPMPVQSCFSANWDGRDGLHPAAVCPPWTLAADGVPIPTYTDSIVRFNLPEITDFASFRQNEELLNITYPWTLEARVQLISGSSASDLVAPAEILFSNGDDTVNVLHITVDTVFLWTKMFGSPARGKIALVDTDDAFHTYRIEVINPIEFNVFYDDSLLLRDTMVIGAGLSSPLRVGWGKIFAGSAGVSDWLFVRHTSYDTTIDFDSDGFNDCVDNCPNTFNPLQEDFDDDGRGDSCYIPVYLTPLTVVARDSTVSIAGTRVGRLDPVDPAVNVNVIDPDSLVIGADSVDNITNTIGDSANYYQVDGNDSVVINDPKTGDYIIEVIPELNGNPASQSYIIGIRTDGTVENIFGPTENPLTGMIDTVFHYSVPYAFGDCDGSRSVNIADVTAMIARIFSGGPDCDPSESGDANCDGSFNIADVTFLIARIFSGGPAPGCE